MNALVNYVPATTRAVLKRFGGEISVQVGRQHVVVSAHEMPGEVEWRVDLLTWYAKRLVLHSVRLAPQARIALLAHARAVLESENGLHPLEAQAAVDSANRILERLGSPGVSGPPEAFIRMDACLANEWDALERRYRRILAAGR
ncbi:hypothetical protein BJN34_17410 [Cupriavidus necator]|uniref:Uncharacterized protein n=1 Tax=Cupriavidus necator TaxID=106590 RepID=A0A1U9UTU7_CUPNE|nr:hypothetical protein [Cupriavidus necator]AQV95661.1 hypothetical protein BJN34_17410 [Cupriavidus necator]